MKTAGIREFKAKLSAFLREVLSGETLLITDRGHVIAEVRPPNAPERSLDPQDVRFMQAVEHGLIRPASLPREERHAALEKLLKWPGLGLPKGTAAQLLDELRGDS